MYTVIRTKNCFSRGVSENLICGFKTMQSAKIYARKAFDGYTISCVVKETATDKHIATLSEEGWFNS